MSMKVLVAAIIVTMAGMLSFKAASDGEVTFRNGNVVMQIGIEDGALNVKFSDGLCCEAGRQNGIGFKF